MLCIAKKHFIKLSKANFLAGMLNQQRITNDSVSFQHKEITYTVLYKVHTHERQTKSIDAVQKAEILWGCRHYNRYRFRLVQKIKMRAHNKGWQIDRDVASPIPAMKMEKSSIGHDILHTLKR